jgi:hypothetical protein
MKPENAFFSRSFPYSTQFKQGLLWNFIDSGGSQGLVILFHLFFRAYAGPFLHGIMGCMLSVLYLGVTVANLGLDPSMAPYLETFTANRASLRSSIKKFIIPQLILLCILAAFFYTSFQTLRYVWPIIGSIALHLTNTLVILFSLTFVTESVRKIIRNFLQLSFYTRITALIEILGTAAYLIGVIVAYWADSLDLVMSWSLLFLSSVGQLVLLLIALAHRYYSLESHGAVHTISVRRMLPTRFFSWSNICINQIFSGNFLVPVCAFHFGIESASLMKVISSIAYWIKLIAQKVFGISGNALLAHLKSRTPELQRSAFNYLASLTNQALYGLLIFFVINGKKLALMQMAHPVHLNWSILYFMLILTFLEGFFVLYEKWYIFEEKASVFFLFNGISIALIYVSTFAFENPLLKLLTIIAVRVLSFIALSLFSFYRWKLWPSFKPEPLLLIFTTAFALMFYLVV